MTINITAQKKALRQQVLTERDVLLEVERLDISRIITERLTTLPEYSRAQVVLAYMNFGSEFNSSLFVRRALADAKTVLLPRVDKVVNELAIYRVDDPVRQLSPGAWGIMEPVPERCERLSDLNEVEFALLPGVAYTRSGARLGYGGGYYDKLLARMGHQPVLVAAAYSLQVVQDVPQESTDRSVEWVVTEREIIACKP